MSLLPAHTDRKREDRHRNGLEEGAHEGSEEEKTLQSLK